MNNENGKKHVIKQELLFLIGLPASGKTTWCRDFVHFHDRCDNWVRVSRDDLRRMRGVYWLPKQEDMITDWEIATTALALIDGRSVVLDATNLYEDRRDGFVKRVCKAIEIYKANSEERGDVLFKIGEKRFDTPVDECIQRDKNRPEHERVGDKVIMNMARKAGLIPEPPKVEYDPNKEDCIIVDIDGTLAHNKTGRGFYDWSRVGEDEVDRTLADMVNVYESIGMKIIIVSGRDDICMEETEKWLADNHIEYHELIMRPHNNYEKDSIIKKRIYEEQIKDRYNVLFVLDDRDQTVKAWRDLGLKCLQVNYGDF